MAGVGGAAREGAPMNTRNRLPDPRPAESFELEVEGIRYTATLGRFPDGSVGELFLNNHKCNSSADTTARDSAIVLFRSQFSTGLIWKRSGERSAATAKVARAVH